MRTTQIVLGLAMALGFSAPAFATWSVIAIDAKTGQVIISSATCVRQQGFPERKPNGARDLNWDPAEHGLQPRTSPSSISLSRRWCETARAG